MNIATKKNSSQSLAGAVSKEQNATDNSNDQRKTPENNDNMQKEMNNNNKTTESSTLKQLSLQKL